MFYLSNNKLYADDVKGYTEVEVFFNEEGYEIRKGAEVKDITKEKFLSTEEVLAKYAKVEETFEKTVIKETKDKKKKK